MKSSEFYEVVVFGGGPAGFPAAIQSARAGAKTLLVEKSGTLGGTTTLNQVSFPGLFHAWGKQIIAGIGWELIRRTVELEDRPLPDFSKLPSHHWRHQVSVAPGLLSALIAEEVTASKCRILLHTLPAAISRGQSDDWDIQLCGKEGLFSIRCAWIIDATGDANAAVLAGCPLQPPSATLQPGTLAFSLEGYDLDSLSIARIDAAVKKALQDGNLHAADLGWGKGSIEGLLRSGGANSIHVPRIDGSDSAGKTQAELKSRAALLRVFRFLKSQDGFDNLRLRWAATECGIRETRNILGRTTISHEDYRSGRLWPDAVSFSFYPIDLHTDEGLQLEQLKQGVVPTIPLSAMAPRGVPRFLAAGRCISGDRLAHSAFRVQASCMAMGQAAGAVAAMAAKASLDEAELVPRRDLRRTLEENGAIFPDGTDRC